MALPNSGPISFSQVNVELGNSPTATISLGDSAVRDLAGVSSGAISMSDLHGKRVQIVHTMNIGWNGYVSGYAHEWSGGSFGSWDIAPTASLPGLSMRYQVARYYAGYKTEFELYSAYSKNIRVTCVDNGAAMEIPAGSKFKLIGSDIWNLYGVSGGTRKFIYETY